MVYVYMYRFARPFRTDRDNNRSNKSLYNKLTCVLKISNANILSHYIASKQTIFFLIKNKSK